MYRSIKRRAQKAGEFIDYGVEDFLAWLRERLLLDPQCRYCHDRIGWETCSVDHRRPIARGGHSRFSNLDVVCRPCNAAKGPMDHAEFKELLELISNWDRRVSQNLKMRLIAGAGAGSKMFCQPDGGPDPEGDDECA